MKVEKLDHYGRGIIHVNNKICFVENALKDEDIEINILLEKKKYLEAIVKEYKNKSINRVTPNCKYYGLCGGCKISHMILKKQEEFKQKKVEEIITKFTKEKCNVKEICYDKEFGYRNKVVLHVKKDKLGFYKEKTNEIIDIDKCLLLNNKINEVIKVIKKEHSINEITIKQGNITEEIMVVIDGNITNYDDLINIVDVLIINDKCITEKNYIISIIGNKKYKISNKSFFQINSFITEKLYNEVLNAIIDNKSKNVLDLYCGTGTIGIYIADKVNKVIGIELVKEAIEDAKFNKKFNNVDNIEFINGKVEDKIHNIKDDIDTIILDPPRSGLHEKVLLTLEKIKAKNIIYVSCDPVTLARDLKELTKYYNISYVKPFDMFPNTYHVECVCVMKLR